MSQSPAASSHCFPTTQWTEIIQVMQQGRPEEAASALAAFYERYRPAIYHFFCRKGCTHERAEDLMQAFFESRIMKRWDNGEGFLHVATRREKEKFRSFLCHVLWLFLKDEWKKSPKAGDAMTSVPLDELTQEFKAENEDASESFQRSFDQSFVLEVIQRAASRSRHSRHILNHLKGEISQAEAARQLGLSEAAFKQAYHRFREKLAKDLWEEVSKLVGPSEQQIREEIQYIMCLFGKNGS